MSSAKYLTSIWSRYRAKSKHLGFGHVLTCLLDRWRCRRLQKVFGFDPWHCEGAWHCRPYKHVGVNLANRVNAGIVVEVGCGLGDIVSRVRAERRVGYDTDEAVIRAARSIRGSKVQFNVGSIADIQEEKIDLLILVNWIHEVPPEELENMMGLVAGRSQFILLDRIFPGAEGYLFHHDFHFLNARFSLRDCVAGGAGEPREMLLFEARN